MLKRAAFIVASAFVASIAFEAGRAEQHRDDMAWHYSQTRRGVFFCPMFASR